MSSRLWRRLTDPSVLTAKVVFYRGLATLINAGVPLTRSLDMLGCHAENLTISEAVLACSSLVNAGHSLSRAMARNGHVFPPGEVSMIAASEQTGSLHSILDRLAKHQEQVQALRNRVQAALVYPVVVFTVCLGLLIAIPAFAFQGLLRFFEDMRLELPWSTKLMLALFRLGKQPLVILLLIASLGVVVFLARRAWAEPAFRLRVERLLRRVPAIGTVLQVASAGEFCRVLAAMYESGIPMLKALELSAHSNPSPVLREDIGRASHDLREGTSLAGAFTNSAVLPRMVPHLLEVGEQTGALSRLLLSAARLCEESLDESLAIAEGLLQPLMLGVLGFLAGFVVLATMSPLIKLAQTL